MASPRLVQRTEAFSLRSDGTARLAVVADTHSEPHPASADRLAELRPDAVLHAGDIGELSVLDRLSAIAPLFAVRGNIDNRASHLPDVVLLDLMNGEQRFARLLLTHIAVAGPRIRAEIAKLARAEGAQLIVCGHSHVPFMNQEKGLTVFNPGSIGPRRFHLPIVFGTIDIAPTGIRLAHIDCETGKPWSPPGMRPAARP